MQDIRYTPVLSHPAAVAAARSFADLQDVAECFAARRAALMRVQRSCSIVRTHQPSRQHQRHQLQLSKDCIQPSTTELKESEYTFAAGLLSIADPSVPLLSSRDAARCLHAFVERAVAEVAGSASTIAEKYSKTTSPTKLQAARYAEALDVLQRPLRAISDSGLSNAFVLHMSRMLRTTLVVRRGTVGSVCDVFPPDAAGTSPCAMFGRADDAHGFAVLQYGLTLREVQIRLAADLGPFIAHGRAALEEVIGTAATLGIAPVASATGKPKTKAALVQEITEISSLVPRSCPLGAFITL